MRSERHNVEGPNRKAPTGAQSLAEPRRQRRGSQKQVLPPDGPTGIDCIVRSKKPGFGSDQSLPPNLAQYGIFQRAYDYFNTALFNSSLPQVLITMQRDHRSYGYFTDDSYQNRLGNRRRIHEICLNPNGFVGRNDEDILSTQVHEMAHVYQHEYGEPGRGRYHNRDFARLMYSIGLMPSATGKPGGAEIGDQMSHYILEGGPFATACAAFLEMYGLAWESAAEFSTDAAKPGAVGTNSTTSRRVTSRSKSGDKSKTKFRCPNGHGNAWARPSANLLCGDCYGETREAVPLRPCARRKGDTE
jgi:hypothetical protein